MRVVFLNGPPRSGKDTAGAFLARDFGAGVFKFAGALKRATHELYGLAVATDAFEAVKDEPSAEFFGLSPRQAYIAVSERAVKPAFGEAFFGAVLAARLARAKPDLAVITDSGFYDEMRPIVQQVGAERCLLIRLHRHGCTFVGDSRSYLRLLCVAHADIDNNGTLDDLRTQVRRVVADWISTTRKD